MPAAHLGINASVLRKKLDIDTPRGQDEMPSYPGPIFVSMVSFHKTVVCMAIGIIGRNGITLVVVVVVVDFIPPGGTMPIGL